MITYRQGNLLDADVEAVVNTVNTVGVMGKGIALMFKERYPDIFKTYAAALLDESFHPLHHNLSSLKSPCAKLHYRPCHVTLRNDFIRLSSAQ